MSKRNTPEREALLRSPARIDVAVQLRKRLDALKDFLDGDREYFTDVSLVPSTMGALRDWHLAHLGIFPIASKASTNIRLTGTEESRKLLPQLDEVLRRIALLKRTRQARPRRLTRDEQIQRLKGEVADANDDRDASNARYHEIAHALEDLKDQCAARQEEVDGLTRALSDLQARHDDFCRKLSTGKANLALVSKDPN